MVSIGEWLATASHGVADRRERRFLRSRRLRKHVLIGSADRRRKAHAVHGREKGGEPGRTCRQRVPERMMAGLRDPVFAHQDLAGIMWFARAQLCTLANCAVRQVGVPLVA